VKGVTELERDCSDSLEIATLGNSLPIGRSAKNPNAVTNKAIMNTKRSSTLCVMQNKRIDRQAAF